MAVRVDQAGQQGAVLPVKTKGRALWTDITLVQQFGDAAVLADQQTAEMYELATNVDRVAVDVIDL